MNNILFFLTPRAMCAYSVSYTHLDVYKRQANVGAQLRTSCSSDMAVLPAPGDSAQAFPDGNDAHGRHSDSRNGTGAGQNRGNFHSSNLPFS